MYRVAKEHDDMLSLFNLVKDGGGLRNIKGLFFHAIKHKSVDVICLMLKYDSDFASFDNFYWCSLYFEDHPRREDALKLILENAKNIHKWVDKGRYFRAIRTASDVFMFANHGARFSGKEIFDFYDDF